QAEDGIRDDLVTGVQTCALPISMAVATGVADVVVCWRAFNERSGFRFGGSGRTSAETPLFMAHYAPFGLLTPAAWVALHAQRYRSEERRVGKEWTCRGDSDSRIT